MGEPHVHEAIRQHNRTRGNSQACKAIRRREGARDDQALPNIITQPYTPKITTPYQLEKKLGELIAFVNQKRVGKTSTIGRV